MLGVSKPVSSLKSFLFSVIETFLLVSSAYSWLWQRYVSIAKKLKNNSMFGLGVTGNDFYYKLVKRPPDLTKNP